MALQKLPYEQDLGRYRLVARLGRGGMADVFLARLVGAGGFEKLVAIKRMLPALSSDPTFVEMFLKEGRITAQLDHPNICHVYELGEAEGTLFLAMELLRGLPWSEVVPAIPDRPRQAAIRFIAGAIMQACEGLHHAHTAPGADGQPLRLVHRDVSPSNLFISNEGSVKLLDFGVSKITSEVTRTPSGMLKGKLPYMAPEQLRGHTVDPRADIFSLAVIAWEAIAGRALFDRASDYDTMLAVAQAEVPELPGADPALAPVDAALRRALAREPGERPGSARELAYDLRRAIAAFGEPMIASEIEAHMATWLAPSLARKSRDLAAVLRPAPMASVDETVEGGTTGERTAIHTPEPAAGVRLRKVAIVVGPQAAHPAELPRLSDPLPPSGPQDTVVDPVPLLPTLRDEQPMVLDSMPNAPTLPRRAPNRIELPHPGPPRQMPAHQMMPRSQQTPPHPAMLPRPAAFPHVSTGTLPPNTTQTEQLDPWRSWRSWPVLAIIALVTGLIAALLLV